MADEKKEVKEINLAVWNLLDKLVADHPAYRWESMCIYSDGLARTILEISIYAEKGNRQTGRIIFHVETGDVLHYYYTGYKDREVDSVIDLLLDILNMIKMEQNAA